LTGTVLCGVGNVKNITIDDTLNTILITPFTFGVTRVGFLPIHLNVATLARSNTCVSKDTRARSLGVLVKTVNCGRADFFGANLVANPLFLL
jgi:hypothetical protein